MKNHEMQGEYFTRPVRLGYGVRDFAAGVLNALANVDILDI